MLANMCTYFWSFKRYSNDDIRSVFQFCYAFFKQRFQARSVQTRFFVSIKFSHPNCHQFPKMLAITRHRRWILQLIRQAGFWTGDIFHTANISACRFSWVLSSGPRSCVLKCPALLAQCQLGHTCRKWRVKCVCPCFILTERERCLLFFLHILQDNGVIY